MRASFGTLLAGLERPCLAFLALLRFPTPLLPSLVGSQPIPLSLLRIWSSDDLTRARLHTRRGRLAIQIAPLLPCMFKSPSCLQPGVFHLHCAEARSHQRPLSAARLFRLVRKPRSVRSDRSESLVRGARMIREIDALPVGHRFTSACVPVPAAVPRG